MTSALQQHVYLVDDDQAVRAALQLLLRTMGLNVKIFADPMAFLSVHPDLPPGCLVLDIRMPHLSGLKVQEKLVLSGCDWPVIVISGHGDIQACRQAFKNGAIDFLSKPIDEQDLIDAIQRGQKQLVDSQMRTAQFEESAALLKGLSPRELQVLDLVCRGFITREIANSLGLSPRTIESHRANVAKKLGTSSPAEMARIMVEGNATA